MGLISKSRLISYRNSTRFYSKSLNESLTEFKNESKFNKTTIFLSHKHDEIEELDSAISFLKSLGVKIYVDWQDEQMPQETSAETASKIKTKIKENKKFILLASEGAISSRWCNWELGLGDAEKFIKHITILPVKNNYSDYSGAEYLNIYPYILYESDLTKNTFYLQYPTGEVVNLQAWISS